MMRSQSCLDLPSPQSGYRLIDNAIQSLSRVTKLHTRQIDNAARLATMLVAVSRIDDAEQLLDSVVSHAAYNGDESMWAAFGCCICHRSYLARKSGEDQISRELMKLIAENELLDVTNGISAVAQDILEEHDDEISVARSETPAHAIDLLAGRVCDYLYVIESNESLYGELSKSCIDNFHQMLDECMQEISSRLSD